MRALRIIRDVSKDGYVHVKIPSELGDRIELIILPHPGRDDISSTDYMRLQEESGFVRDFLSSEEEDVWNDI